MINLKDNSIDSNLMSIFNSIAQNFYQDLIHPPAEQLGIALGQMASAVRITTLPFAIAGYTADSLLNKYKTFLDSTFQKVPRENLTIPDPAVSVPVLQKVPQVFDKDDLCELFSNLLASASDKSKSDKAHPAFAEIIAQMDSLEAHIMSGFEDNAFLPFMACDISIAPDEDLPLYAVEAFCLISGHENDYANVSAGLINLQRLGLIRKSPPLVRPNGDDPFQKIYDSDVFASIRELQQKFEKEHLQLEHGKITVKEGSFTPTIFGHKFLSTCL